MSNHGIDNILLLLIERLEYLGDCSFIVTMLNIIFIIFITMPEIKPGINDRLSIIIGNITICMLETEVVDQGSWVCS